MAAEVSTQQASKIGLAGPVDEHGCPDKAAPPSHDATYELHDLARRL